jgi:hypothetical protein
VAPALLGLFLGVAACAEDRSDAEASPVQQVEAATLAGQADSLRAALPVARPALDSAAGLAPVISASRQLDQDTIRARYPREWDVEVPPGTRLDSLRRQLDREIRLLPPGDLEDQTPLPIWFRVYLRKQNPDMATSGPYQYPRTAPRLLRWMLAHPDSVGSRFQ